MLARSFALIGIEYARAVSELLSARKENWDLCDDIASALKGYLRQLCLIVQFGVHGNANP